MRYDAITIDTNIFADNGYRLESGLLSQLSQFKDGQVKFVLSEIVYRELCRHLLAAASDFRKRLISTVKKARHSGLLQTLDVETLINICTTSATPDDVISIRLAAFSMVTGMEIIGTDGISLKALLDRYFSVSPPLSPPVKRRRNFRTP